MGDGSPSMPTEPASRELYCGPRRTHNMRVGRWGDALGTSAATPHRGNRHTLTLTLCRCRRYSQCHDSVTFVKNIVEVVVGSQVRGGEHAKKVTVGN